MIASLNAGTYVSIHVNTAATVAYTAADKISCNVRNVRSITANDAAATVSTPQTKAQMTKNTAIVTTAM